MKEIQNRAYSEKIKNLFCSSDSIRRLCRNRSRYYNKNLH